MGKLLMILKKKNNVGPQRLVCATPVQYACIYYHKKYSNISSETAWPIKAKFYMEHLCKGGSNVNVNNPGHTNKLEPCPYMFVVKIVQNLLL